MRVSTGIAAALLCATVLHLPNVCGAHVIQGVVRGGAEAEGSTVLGLRSRNVHRGQSIIAAYSAVGRDGSFELRWDGPSSLWLVVARRDAAASPADLLRSSLVMAASAPVMSGAADVLLQVPSNRLTQSLWRGTTASNTPLAIAGYSIIALLIILAAWLRRRPAEVVETALYTADWRIGAAWFGLAVAMLSLNVGGEPFDLLEYSYFHEGLRPPSYAGVLSDPISAELAHGPVMPLIHRFVSEFSTAPFVLRIPSVLFGALFVWCVWSLSVASLGQRAGNLAAAIALGAPVAFFYSRDATPYALTGLLAASSAWLAVRASRSVKPVRWWCVFSALQIVGFFTHYGYTFFSAALGLTLIIAWSRRRPRQLSYALIAFAVAAILPVLRADSLFTMLELSGARFALMSPVYPESPGLPWFIAQFVTVLSGLPEWLPVGLVVVIPLWCVGLVFLWRTSRMLAWFSIIQVALLMVWLVFSHTMSVDYGGGRVFYAYRWTRPLLLGVILPYAGLALHSTIRWGATALAIVLLCSTAASAFDDKRPAIGTAAGYVSSHAEPGDAWAVLPAAFYGDPVLHALHDGSPPQLITGMHSFDSSVDAGVIRGPAVETYQPFETAIDRLSFRTVWVFEFAETMFGTPKFDPTVVERTRAVLEAEGWTVLDEHSFPHLTVRRYRCNIECEWLDRKRLIFRPQDRLLSERYLVAPAGAPFPAIPDRVLPMVLPRQTRSIVVRWASTGSGAVRLSGLQCTDAEGSVTCAVGQDVADRIETTITLSDGLTSADITIEVSR